MGKKVARSCEEFLNNEVTRLTGKKPVDAMREKIKKYKRFVEDKEKK